MMKVYPKSLFNELVSHVSLANDKSESLAIIHLLLEKKLGWMKHHILINDERHVDDDALDACRKMATRVAEGEPIQYILESAEFFGLDFYVNPSVLIPRPETEELVSLILKENNNPKLEILDIGTGSGCIPVALKKNIPDAIVHALDISEGALSVAKKNAATHGVTIHFYQQDIINDEPAISNLDCIVSNPPYIGYDEVKTMSDNTQHEPEIALFPKDEDTLIFYRTIAFIGKNKLKSGGKIYFEINENYPEDVKEILIKTGYTHIQILKDLNEKNRVIKAEFF